MSPLHAWAFVIVHVVFIVAVSTFNAWGVYYLWKTRTDA